MEKYRLIRRISTTTSRLSDKSFFPYPCSICHNRFKTLFKASHSKPRQKYGKSCTDWHSQVHNVAPRIGASARGLVNGGLTEDQGPTPIFFFSVRLNLRFDCQMAPLRYLPASFILCRCAILPTVPLEKVGYERHFKWYGI